MHGDKRKDCRENFKESISEINNGIFDSNGNVLICKRRKFSGSLSKGKMKKDQEREPLPMKLRALPRSFWQQPNQPARQSPGELCPDLPLLCKDEDTAVRSTPCQNTVSKSPRIRPPEITTPANTELLFSLFRVVDNKHKSLIRRGRPRKPASSQLGLRDADPCLVSTVNEPPLAVGVNKGRENGQNDSYSNLLAELVVRL